MGIRPFATEVRWDSRTATCSPCFSRSFRIFSVFDDKRQTTDQISEPLYSYMATRPAFQ